MARQKKVEKLQVLNEAHRDALLGEIDRMNRLLASIPDAMSCGLQCEQYEQGAKDGITAAEKLLDTYFPGWRHKK